MKYKDYIISENPACAREHRYSYQHKNFDGLDDPRFGNCKTIEECEVEIDEREDQAADYHDSDDEEDDREERAEQRDIEIDDLIAKRGEDYGL